MRSNLTKYEKKIIRFCFFILLILPLLTFAHFIIFPQETRCILISFSGFDKAGNIYLRDNAKAKVDTLLQLKSIAEKRNNDFWKSNSILNYHLIYCDTKKDFNNYGMEGAPAVTQLKLGAWVVIQDVSLDADIISHEISHSVLYNNIGWYKTIYKIPTWFSEGLAMQVDDRDYYSIDTLMSKQKAGIKLPDITLMNKPAEFFAGSNEVIMLNFSTAKYVVSEWLKTNSLEKFIKEINSGTDFNIAYQQK